MQKLPAPRQKATCTHILCEQERRKVTRKHVLSVGSADEKGMGRDYRVERTRVTFVNFEEKLKREKTSLSSIKDEQKQRHGTRNKTKDVLPF